MGDSFSKRAMQAYSVQDDEEDPYAGHAAWGRRCGKKKATESVPREPCDTVIIFDWDDTLLCSSAINRQESTPRQLQLLEQSVEAILLLAISLGETHIVTNGNETWVRDSGRHFLPKLTPVLSRVKVASARAAYEPTYPGDPFMWKSQAFKDILVARRGTSGSASQGVNLVALGDSLAEIEAAGGATKVLLGPSLVKTVKFKEMPSANEVLGQLRKVKKELRQLVQMDRNISRGLVQRHMPAHLDHVASWASGWQVCDREFEVPGCLRPWAALFGA